MPDRPTVLERANKRHRAALEAIEGMAETRSANVDQVAEALAIHTGIPVEEFAAASSKALHNAELHLQLGAGMREIVIGMTYTVFLLGWFASETNREFGPDGDKVQLPPIPREMALDLVAGWSPPPGIAYDRWSDAIQHLQEIAAISCTPVTDDEYPPSEICPND